MSFYFELNFSNNSRPRPHYPTQRRTTSALKLSTIQTSTGKVTYHILGIDDEETWKYIQTCINGKIPNVDLDRPLFKDARGEFVKPFRLISAKDKCTFSFKGQIIHSDNIVMAGEAKYSAAIESFCKKPKRGKFFHYGNREYDYFGTGIETANRMWKVIKEVLFNPTYCIVYEAS